MRRRWRVLLAVAALSWMAAACGVVAEDGGARSGGSPGPERREAVSGSDAVELTRVAGSNEPAPATASGVPSPTAGATPARVYGCSSGPCPRGLRYAVNGCTCAGQTYDESEVSAAYCCADGFSDSPCPESLATESALESAFGSTQEEVESALVTVTLKGWPARVHARAEAAFRRVAERLESVDYEIREPIGSFSWRVVGGRNVLSSHSFGVAIDINASTNPQCGVSQYCRCSNDLITDMPPEFVQAFKDEGFEWGGDWTEHPDPMHFEWVGWR